jgi:hypothetical protein
MEQSFSFTAIFFIFITCITIWLFYRAAGNSKIVLYGILTWMLIQSGITLSGFYQNGTALPPRFVYLVGPALIIILILFLTRKGRQFIDRLNPARLTLLHSVRVPVEIVLYLLHTAGLIPRIMTFEGWNFDIVSGLTAPLIYYLVFVSKKAGRKVGLTWNLVCLALLVNIVAIAVLAARTPFQQLAIEQPNVAITYFPFSLLAAVVVPLVLLSHLAAIRQFLKRDPEVR